VRFGGLIAKRWPGVGGILLVVAMLGLLWWSLWESREPVYDGKPISYWLRQPPGPPTPFSGAFRPPEVPEALLADSNAVPRLVKGLGRQETPLDKAYSNVWQRITPSIQRRLPQPVDAVRVRATAAHLLADMGALAKPAIQALVRALQDNSPLVRSAAATPLGLLGPGDETVYSALKAALRDKDNSVQFHAAYALAQLGQNDAAVDTILKPWMAPPAAVPPAPRPRWYWGPGRMTVSPELIAALKDSDPSVRIAATNALRRLDPEVPIGSGFTPAP
jgi:hypothetical protein